VLVVFSLIARVSAAPSAAEYVDQAVKLYNQGNCTKAVEVLKKAIAVNPSYARAYSWLGLCYARMGRTQEAIAAFKKVIALAPKSEDARIAQQWIAKLQQSVAQQPPASPVAPRVTAAAPVFLVDLPAATGVAEANRPRQVQLFGQTYRKAIAERRSWGRTWGGNPEWRIVYNVGRRYARFRVLAGVADGERPDFTAVFEVRGDGNTLHESKPKRAGDIPENLDLDITGVLQLELLVRGPEQYDQATVVWADPRVLPPGAVSGAAPGATAPPPSPAPPASPAPSAPSSPQPAATGITVRADEVLRQVAPVSPEAIRALNDREAARVLALGRETAQRIVVLAQQGVQAMRVKDWTGCVETFARVLGYDPENFQALFNQAGCLYELGILDRSIERALRAIQKIPHPALYFVVGSCYVKLGDRTRALAWLAAAVKGGFRDLQMIQENFAPLRNDPDYLAIVALIR